MAIPTIDLQVVIVKGLFVTSILEGGVGHVVLLSLLVPQVEVHSLWADALHKVKRELMENIPKLKATMIQYICMKLKQVVRDNLRKYMAARDMDQAELARRCGLTQSALSRFLSEDRAPNIDSIERIAAALKLAPFMLLMPVAGELENDLLTLWDAVAELPAEEREDLISYAYFRKQLISPSEAVSRKKSRA